MAFDKNLLQQLQHFDARPYRGGYDFPFLDESKPPSYSIEGDKITIRTPQGEQEISDGCWIIKAPGYYMTFTAEEFTKELIPVTAED